jgi:Mor family transcriptional regulator
MQMDNVALPENLKDIIQVIGLQSALKLVEELGGIRMYIPEKLSTKHVLIQAVGKTDAEKISRHYAGDYLYFPRCMDALRSMRNASIINDRNQGTPTATLALKYKLTERQVQNILAAAQQQKDERQQDLFQ